MILQNKATKTVRVSRAATHQLQAPLMLLALRRNPRVLCSQAQRPAFALAACRGLATAAAKDDDAVVKIYEGPLNAAVKRIRLVSLTTLATSLMLPPMALIFKSSATVSLMGKVAVGGTAMVAGVGRRVMVVPARDGVMNPLVLAAAALAGVNEVWRIGGAQAVAALAYGTQTLAHVDKIVGPGNAFVASAKRQVFGQVGIDSIAGPSEILVVADAQNDPTWIAADLLSQAEHDEAAQSILITDDIDFANQVALAVNHMLPKLERADVAGRSWADNGAIITVPSMDDMPELANRIAAEHLELALKNAADWSKKIRHAGAIFMGRYTPEAIGDYVAGPNHVLPTARTARFSSGLGVTDFMKRTTTVGCDVDGFAAIAPSGVMLADAEGLGAHALSMRLRMKH